MSAGGNSRRRGRSRSGYPRINPNPNRTTTSQRFAIRSTTSSGNSYHGPSVRGSQRTCVASSRQWRSSTVCRCQSGCSSPRIRPIVRSARTSAHGPLDGVAGRTARRPRVRSVVSSSTTRRPHRNCSRCSRRARRSLDRRVGDARSHGVATRRETIRRRPTETGSPRRPFPGRRHYSYHHPFRSATTNRTTATRCGAREYSTRTAASVGISFLRTTYVDFSC